MENTNVSITGQELLDSVTGVFNSYETTSAINKLLGSVKSDPKLREIPDLSSLNDSDSAEAQDVKKSDFGKSLIEKATAIGAIVKHASNRMIPTEMIDQLLPQQKEELKLFSFAMIALKAFSMDQEMEDVKDFIRSKMNRGAYDVTSLSAADVHSIMESVLHSNLSNKLLPKLDEVVPGGINTISFVIDGITTNK